MAVSFDKWTLLKLFEFIFAVSCLICKAVTDDETSRLSLYLQKLSREWSLLTSVTWDKVGNAVADATYGGYVIITGALFIGKLTRDLPTIKRITEIVLLLLGTLFYVVLGSLEFASLESIPPDLIDNAAVLGTLSLITAALFLLDLGGPRAKKPQPHALIVPQTTLTKQYDKGTSTTPAYNLELEREFERSKRQNGEEKARNGTRTENGEQAITRANGNLHANGNLRANGNGYAQTYPSNGHGITQFGRNGYEKMKEEDDRPKKSKRFDIYGKDGSKDEPDGAGDRESELEFDDASSKTELHSPVWSKVRKGQYGKYDVVTPPGFLYEKGNLEDRDDRTRPSGPGDPGYVQYTAQRWGQPTTQKTPRHSPTEV